MDRRSFVALVGSALAAPLARAQRSGKIAKLGILGAGVVLIEHPFWKPFFAALGKRGWPVGGGLSLEIREGRGDPARALAMARELVGQRVDAILAISTLSAVAAKAATEKIPVVTWCGYPVEAGLARSLARPGGTVTGVANYAGAPVWGKFVELLREVKPGMRELGVLWDYSPPGFPDGEIPIPVIQKSAQQMGIKTHVWMVRSEQNLDEALAAIGKSSVEALILTNGGGFHNQPELADRIGGLIVRRRLPVVVDVTALAFQRANCLFAYSPNVPEVLTRLAGLVDQVLRGASPADLPFELPARFDLAVNASAAKAIGLTIPQSILLRADRVIE
jgi:putative ABC transport system substrate-binding protein